MSEARPRVPIEPGFFTIPKDSTETPRLLGSRCRACGEHFFPQREICARCLHLGTDPVLLGPRGSLYTYTYVHFPLFGSKRADAGGYGVGQVDLPEGPRVQAVLSGGPDDFTIGMAMERSLETLRETKQGEDVVIYRFRPAQSGGRLSRAVEVFEVSLRDVAVLGVGTTRFGVYPDRSNADLGREAGLAALSDAGIGFGEIGEAFVGYLFDGVMAGIKAMKEFGLTGLPVTHVENASATGLVAFRDAAWAVASGRCDIAMALGFDKMSEAARTSPRGGVGRDAIDQVILPAAYFSLWAMRRMHERGTRPEHFAAIAAKNWNHGALNPFSHRQPEKAVTPEQVLASRKIAEPVTAMMTCPVDDGAACAILARADLARKLQPDRPLVRVLASVLQTETYTPGHTFLGPVVGPASMTRDTAKQAFEEAGLGPEDVDLVLVHDAFANEELEYYELMGFCGEGEGEKLVEEGQTRLGGRIPFNTDGGLIARGHPGGPTGLAQIHELVAQLRGEADRRQVEGARTGVAQLVGGGSVCTISVLQRD